MKRWRCCSSSPHRRQQNASSRTRRGHRNPATLVTPTVSTSRVKLYLVTNNSPVSKEGERDDETHHGDKKGVARCAPRSARGGEGAHAAQRRGGAAASGPAVGSDRQDVSIRDRPGTCLAGRPLQRALAAACLPLHVRTRLHGGVCVVLDDRGWVQRFHRPPGQP